MPERTTITVEGQELRVELHLRKPAGQDIKLPVEQELLILRVLGHVDTMPELEVGNFVVVSDFDGKSVYGAIAALPGNRVVLKNPLEGIEVDVPKERVIRVFDKEQNEIWRNDSKS